MISQKLKDEIWDYCRMNDITDVNGFIQRMVQQGYNIEKYGTAPIDLTPEVKEVEKIVEVEVIKEVVKEVPVEVIKEVEVIREVPVEVIKEIEKVVEKEVYVTDDVANKELQNKIGELEGEIERLNNLVEAVKKDEKVHKESVYSISKERKELQDEVTRLTKELEIEKAKPKREKKEIKLPESNNPRSAINWVSRTERGGDDLYGD